MFQNGVRGFGTGVNRQQSIDNETHRLRVPSYKAGPMNCVAFAVVCVQYSWDPEHRAATRDIGKSCELR
jgi:hypothetical protein